MKEKKFPKGFYWGAATSSYQVEGGIENCDWAEAARRGRVPPAGKLADHYNRYEEDFDIAKDLGHNAHRFSIEWARIEPEEGKFDEKEIEHYRNVLRALHSRGLTPFITLWHFTLPLWFSKRGGFERKDSPDIFARYCAYVVKELGDLCKHYSIINEPNVWVGHGWLYGAWPPFKRARIFWKNIGKEDGTSEKTHALVRSKHFFTYFIVEKNLVLAHNKAYISIKTLNDKAIVGVVKHVRVFESNRNPFNILRARFMQYFQTYRFMNAIEGHYDEIGLNYYRHTGYGWKRNFLKTDMGWDVFPGGIYLALKKLARYKKPIFVAEAGLADEDDDLRAQYIEAQVEGVFKAIQEGVDVRGHMYWSLIDNYEWALGVGKRFGLVEIDYDTLERRVRPSAQFYKKICENNGIL